MKKISYCWLFLVSFLNVAAATGHAQEKEQFEGRWNVLVTFENGTSAGTLTLDETNSKISGSSSPLDENQFFPLKISGEEKGGKGHLAFYLNSDFVGALIIERKGDNLTGSGELFGVPVIISGMTDAAMAVSRMMHEFALPGYHLQFSARQPPVLRIKSGDTVRTQTLDNLGRDENLTWQAMPGNTLTGPFFIEGAMPGDTLAVYLDRIALNRDTATMYSGMLNQAAIEGGYSQKAEKDWGRIWQLDRAKSVARLKAPGAHLADLEVALTPMLGTIGVAPPLNQAIYAGDLGFHGGNLDYKRITTGTTVYLPVYHAGALLSFGDGHAAQGDGEISGQGLETSLDVTFTVEVIKSRSLGYIWHEDHDFIMVSGIDNSLESSLQMATTGMAKWLKREYSLNDSEIAALMSSSIQYDIAEIVNPRPHVVARISKKILAMLKEK